MNKKLISPVLMWMIVAAGVAISLAVIPKEEIFPRSVYTSVLIVPVGIYWLYFFLSALSVHKKAPLSAEAIDSVVKTGVYSYVRHPIYSADIFLAIGVFFYLPYLDILVAVFWMTMVLLFWMRLEERALTEKFGQKYQDYKKQVPMLIPDIK